MTNESNVTAEGVAIKLADGSTATVQPELLRGWVGESYDILYEADKQKRFLKELVETVSESTKLPKKLVSKFLKARYKESIKAETEAGDVLGKLDEVVGDK